MTRTQNKPLKIGESGCCHKNLSLPFEAASTSTPMTDFSPCEIKTALGFEDKDRDTLVDIFWPAFDAKADWIYKSDVQKEREASAQINSNQSKQQAKSNLNRKKLECESISEFWRIL